MLRDWLFGERRSRSNKQRHGLSRCSRCPLTRRLAFESLEARLALAATGVVETFPALLGRQMEEGGSSLGSSLAIDGDWAVAGAPSDDSSGSVSGSAFVYRKIAGEWTQHSILTPTDPDYGDHFGRSVAIDNGTIVVGARRGHESFERTGFAFVFTLEDDVWSLQAKLDSGTEWERGFGAAVDIDGNTIVVGCDSSPAVYVYERSGSTWHKEAQLTSHPPEGSYEPVFGIDVDLDGNTLAVSAGGYRTPGQQNYGAAYIFQRSADGWVEVERLFSPILEAEASFGSSVVIDGNTLVVGAATHGTRYVRNQGSVFIFSRSGDNWTHVQTLVASDPAENKNFGAAADLEGDTLVIAAAGSYLGTLGSGYLYQQNSQGDWVEIDRFTGIDNRLGFGVSVALEGNDLLVGDMRSELGYQMGVIRTYRVAEFDAEISLFDIRHRRSDLVEINYAIQGSVPDLAIRVYSSADTQFDLGDLPFEVASYSGAASAGFASWQFDPGDYDPARPHLVAIAATALTEHDLANNSLTLRQIPALYGLEQLPRIADEKFTLANEEWYGSIMAIDGNRAVVGVPDSDAVGDDFGAAFVLERQDGRWVQTAMLAPVDGVRHGDFGMAVAIQGDTIVVSAKSSVRPQPTIGATYVFRLIGEEWQLVAKLIIPDAVVDPDFGTSIAIDRNTIAVGEPRGYPYSEGPSVIYLFEQVAGQWAYTSKLTTPVSSHRLGRSIEIAGDRMLISTVDRYGYFRNVYAFSREATGWILQTTLTYPEELHSYGFGAAISIDGDQAVVGSYDKAYVYRWNNGNWEFEAALDSEFPWNENANLPSVSIEGNLVAFGNPSYYLVDAVRLFERQMDGRWLEHPPIHPLNAQPGDRFGISVGLSGGELLVGAPGNTNGEARGGIQRFLISRAHTDVQVFGMHQLSGERAKVQYAVQGDVTGFELAVYRSADASFDTGDLSHNVVRQSITASDTLGTVEFDLLPYDPARPYLIAVATANVAEASTLNNSTSLELLPPLFAIGQFPTLLADETLLSAARYGVDIDIDGDWAVIGAPAHKRGMFRTGAAYVLAKVNGVWIQQAQLLSPAERSVNFGNSVAIDGNTIVVSDMGSSSAELGGGAAYVFERFGNQWQSVQQLKSSDARVSDGFGINLGIDDGTIFVAARAENFGSGPREAIYLFDKQGPLWSEVAAFDGPNIHRDFDFGLHTSLDGGTLVVSMPGLDDHGIVQIYERQVGGWQLTLQLTAPRVETGQQFGRAIDLDEDLLAVVSELATVNIFERTADGWRYREKFAPVAPADGTPYGLHVDLDGDRLALGVDNYGYTVPPIPNTVHLFEHVAGRWLEQQQPRHNGLVDGDDFGVKFALDGDSLLVGAPNRGEPARFAGAVFAYEISSIGAEVALFGIEQRELDKVVVQYHAVGLSSPAQLRVYRSQDGTFDPTDLAFWVFTTQIGGSDGASEIAFDPGVRSMARPYLVAVAVSSDVEHSLANNTIAAVQQVSTGTELELITSALFDPAGGSAAAFGTALDVDGDRAVVGAYLEKQGSVTKGAAYVVERQSNGQWTRTAKLVVPNLPTGTQFGASVAIDGDLIVVGAHLDDERGSDAGAAYIFRFNGSQWVQEAKLLGEYDGDFFGYSVAIADGTVVVGAYGSDYSSSRINGGAFVFERMAGTWTEVAALGNPPAFDYGPHELGRAVAISEDYIAVGAPNFYLSGSQGTGGVVVWKRSGSSWIYDQTLLTPDLVGGRFGSTLSLSGNILVIGAPQEHLSSTTLFSGAAYVFERDATTWRFRQKLHDPTPSSSELFGSSVQVVGDTILVQVRGGVVPQVASVVYVYQRHSSGQWVSDRTLSFESLPAGLYPLGPVAFDGSTLLVHSTSGVLTDSGPGGLWPYLTNLVDAISVWRIDRPSGPALVGDYNASGAVDAADYSVWRDALGRGVVPFSGADGSGDGFIDQADYQLWRANFGRTAPMASGAGAVAEAQHTSLVANVDSNGARPMQFVAVSAPEVAKSRRIERVATAARASAGHDAALLEWRLRGARYSRSTAKHTEHWGGQTDERERAAAAVSLLDRALESFGQRDSA